MVSNMSLRHHANEAAATAATTWGSLHPPGMCPWLISTAGTATAASAPIGAYRNPDSNHRGMVQTRSTMKNADRVMTLMTTNPSTATHCIHSDTPISPAPGVPEPAKHDGNHH